MYYNNYDDDGCSTYNAVPAASIRVYQLPTATTVCVYILYETTISRTWSTDQIYNIFSVYIRTRHTRSPYGYRVEFIIFLLQHQHGDIGNENNMYMYYILSIYFIFGSPGYFSPYVRICVRHWLIGVGTSRTLYILRIWRYTIYVYIYIYRRKRAWHCNTAVGSKNKGWDILYLYMYTAGLCCHSSRAGWCDGDVYHVNHVQGVGRQLNRVSVYNRVENCSSTTQHRALLHVRVVADIIIYNVCWCV